MFKKTTVNETGLDLLIELATDELKNHTPGTETYSKGVEQLERLYKIKLSMKSDRVSKDGLIAALGNVIGIGMIIRHEQLNTITSKALGFVTKSRI